MSEIESLKPESNFTPQKERGGCLTAYLIMMLIANGGMILLYTLGADFLHKQQPKISVESYYILSMMGALNLGAAILLFNRKKIGFYILCGSAIAALIFNLYLGLNPAMAVGGLIGPVILYALLKPQWNDYE